jgi:hypothetical protein
MPANSRWDLIWGLKGLMKQESQVNPLDQSSENM